MTTDTAAALRAAEIDAEVFLKATKVDGVFDCDPVKNANAKLHRQLSFRQVMVDDLKVMDETAITLCKENDIKVLLSFLLCIHSASQTFPHQASKWFWSQSMLSISILHEPIRHVGFSKLSKSAPLESYIAWLGCQNIIALTYVTAGCGL